MVLNFGKYGLDSSSETPTFKEMIKLVNSPDVDIDEREQSTKGKCNELMVECDEDEDNLLGVHQTVYQTCK